MVKIQKFALIVFLLFAGIASVYGQSGGNSGGTLTPIISNPPPSQPSGPIYYQPGGAPDGGGQSGESRPITINIETAASVAAKEYLQLVPELESMEKTLKEMETAILPLLKAEGFISYQVNSTYSDIKNSYENMKIEYEQKLIEVEQAHKELETAVSSLKTAYGELGDYYKRVGQAGDPVQVSTGSFICSSKDFEAEDFLDRFCVTRNYENTGYVSSFGKNWSCSLDSRIIRGRNPDVNISETLFQDILAVIEQMLGKMTGYEYKWQYHSAHDFTEEKNDLINKRALYKEILNDIVERKDRNSNIDAKNKYAAYGKFENKSSYISSENLLYFIDETGRDYCCKYDDGYWKPLAELDALEFTIYGLDATGAVISDINRNKGYRVIYNDGSWKDFNEYGVLVQEIDRHGNKNTCLLLYGKICEIKLKTNEIISIKRDKNNLITEITGPVSGSTVFKYENDFLTSVSENKGSKISYSYDGYGNLKKIIKPDGNYVQIEYQYSDVLKKNIVTSVNDTSGYLDQFIYDFKNRISTYKSDSGAYKMYRWNNLNQITEENDLAYGSSTIYNLDEKNRITRIKEGEHYRSFYYDDLSRPVKVVFDDGSFTVTDYDAYGNIIYQSDRDGNYNEYQYLNNNLVRIVYNGLIVSEMEYDSKGLIKLLRENSKVYYYSYNDYGAITERVTVYPDGKRYTEKWNYNENNKLIRYIDRFNRECLISYGEKSETLLDYKNCEIKRYYDESGRITEIYETDRTSGITHKKENIYDKKGNLIKVYLDDNLITEKEYNSMGKVIRFVIWSLPYEKAVSEKDDFIEGLVQLNQYDSKNRKVSSSIQSVRKNQRLNYQEVMEELKLCSLSYKSSGKEAIIVVEVENQQPVKYETDAYGRLSRIIRGDGSSEKYIWTKGGKLSGIKYSTGLEKSFSYNSDGSSEYYEKENGVNKIHCKFDSQGRLLSKKDSSGKELVWRYDEYNNLIYESDGKIQKQNAYDSMGFKISSVWKKSNGSIIYSEEYAYDSDHSHLVVKNGNLFIAEYFYDNLGRIKEFRTNKNHLKNYYDILGNCIKQTDDMGNEYDFSYTADGKLKNVWINGEKSESFTWNLRGSVLSCVLNQNKLYENIFDENGFLAETRDKYGNRISYTHDRNGNLTGKNYYDTGMYRYTIDKDNNSILTEDPYGNKGKIQYNQDGKVEYETDFSGATVKYYYAADGSLSGKEFEDGSRVKITSWTDDNYIQQYDFSNNEKYALVKRYDNKIMKITDGEDYISFDYDEFGNMIYQYDSSSDLKVTFFYDSLNRCVGKESSMFSFTYSYDEYSRILEINEKKSGSKILFSYYENGLEKERKYSNGWTVNFSYNCQLNLSSKVTRDAYGCRVEAEFYLYYDNGKIKCKGDGYGNITYFIYDENGKLACVKYPYEMMRAPSVTEYENCGGYIKNDHPYGDVLGLPTEDYYELQKLYDKAGISVHIQPYQDCWFEKYTYTPSGSVEKVENPLGCIVYTYDKENRLLSKSAGQLNPSAEVYQWSERGNLLSINNNSLSVFFEYGALNRPISIIQRNKTTGEYKVTNYTYDLLGRRKSESSGKGVVTKYTYDGISDTLLTSIPYFSNDILVDESFRPEKLNMGTESDRNLRTIRTDEWKTDINSKMQSPVQFFSLSFNGKRYGQVSADALSVGGRKTEFYIFSGNRIRGTSETAVSEKLKNFDIWGNNLESDLFSVSNNGLRDYIPSMKSFTSKDPLKAGGNWYAYCPCDPVNYSDETGLFKCGLSEEQKADYARRISDFLNFTPEKYQQQPKKNGYISEDESLVPRQFDCADTSAYVDYVASKAAGLSDYSPMAQNFSHELETKNIQGAKDSTSSSMYFDVIGGDAVNGVLGQFPEDVVTMVVEGFDSDAIKKSNDASVVAAEKERRIEAMEYLQNPEYVTPGTVFVWQKTALSSSQNWKGHTLSVVSREFDDEGKIAGFIYIEGHTGGDRTELGYMATNDNGNDITSYMGEFMGAYEIHAESYTGACTGS